MIRVERLKLWCQDEIVIDHFYTRFSPPDLNTWGCLGVSANFEASPNLDSLHLQLEENKYN